MKAGWQTKTLGEICTIKGGKRVPKGYKLKTEPTPYPYISVADFTEDGTVSKEKMKYVDAEIFEQIKRYTISSKDLYLSIAGTIGKTGFVPTDLSGASLTENACKLVLGPEVDKEFLYHITRSSIFSDHVENNTRTAAQPKLSLARLKTIPIPLPPLEEQQRIVAVLDEAFEGLARASAHAEANLQNAQELFPSSIAEIFSNSDGWETCSVSEVGEVFDGPHATPKTVDQGPLFLGISSLVDGRIELNKTRHVTEEDFAKWTRRVEPRAGDVVFSYETRLGQVGLIPEGMRCCLGRRMGLIRLDESKVSPEFFVAYYLSPYFQEFLRENTVQGATVDRISIKEFPNFPVLLPQKDVQVAVVEQIAHLRDVHDNLVDQAIAKLQDLGDLRQSLLQKAFAGGLT